jgi:hypothetical protein
LEQPLVLKKHTPTKESSRFWIPRDTQVIRRRFTPIRRQSRRRIRRLLVTNQRTAVLPTTILSNTIRPDVEELSTIPDDKDIIAIDSATITRDRGWRG